MSAPSDAAQDLVAEWFLDPDPTVGVYDLARRIDAYVAAQVRAARRAERERCIMVQCPYCADGDVPDGVWHHGQDRFSRHCSAATLRALGDADGAE